MQKLIHTSDGQLKLDGPVLSNYCKRQGCKINLDHEPVPCVSFTHRGEPCQCKSCISDWQIKNGEES